MKRYLKELWPAILLVILFLITVFGCHDVTPSETKDSLPAYWRRDTIKDTVYRSYKNGKLFGTEVNTYVRRKGIKEPITPETK